MDNDDRFISGIHNYCDRWCERCEFTSRCHVFAAEQEMSDEQKDITNEAFFHNLKDIFAEAKALLIEKAKEFDIELESVSYDEFEEQQERERAIIKGNEISRLAEKYAWDARLALEMQTEWLDESSEDDMQSDVIGVLHWYQFFISAKLRRGLHGIMDEDGGEDLDEINDPQSDANGSVKIGLIAIERSILAWTYLISPDNKTTLGPMIKLLENLRQLTEQKFPNAHDFIRPGFDEIETVM